MTNHRTCLQNLTLAAVALGWAATSSAAQESVPRTVLVEQTYLKAKPGKRADLIRFVKANWFEMDRLGVERGIFASYQLYEDVDANPDWDLVMAVGYPQAQGYEEPGTTAAFTAIRAAHKEVRVDGLGLKDLGAIVRHHRLKLAG